MISPGHVRPLAGPNGCHMRPGGFEPPANGLEVRTGPLHRNAAEPDFVHLCGVEAAPGYLYRHLTEPIPYTHSYTHPAHADSLSTAALRRRESSPRLGGRM